MAFPDNWPIVRTNVRGYVIGSYPDLQSGEVCEYGDFPALGGNTGEYPTGGERYPFIEASWNPGATVVFDVVEDPGKPGFGNHGQYATNVRAQ